VEFLNELLSPFWMSAFNHRENDELEARFGKVLLQTLTSKLTQVFAIQPFD
jgi:hypothetical protein